jgi:DNA repair exonuclease SbcCD ATPase subunit
MTDWLGYCIVTGDEMDTEVFGHHHTYREVKRRWVFELAYGYYDSALARLVADLRRIELRLQTLDREATVRENFLAETPFADIAALQRQLAMRRADLDRVHTRRVQLAADAREVPGVQETRQTLLAARTQHAELVDQVARLDTQIKDLTDLRGQFVSQSGRLTRAVVADEWLVDFDFVVCPRCGNDIDAGRTSGDLCYLCLQEPRPAPSRDQLLAEQDRITNQITETDDIIAARRDAKDRVAAEAQSLAGLTSRLASELDERTAAFVSDRAAQLERNAADHASIDADIARLSEYLTLLHRREDHSGERETLQDQRDEIAAAIDRHELGQVAADDNVRALERRMLEYLRELHIPQLGDELTVRINRTTYLPEVAGRTFDELSSQGLKQGNGKIIVSDGRLR